MTETTPSAEPLAAVAERIEGLLAGFRPQLGDDATAYGNHVRRVFGLVRADQPTMTGDELQQVAIAAVFHDLGVWTAGTFDYLGPSIDLAIDYLAAESKPEWAPRVSRLIVEHHKLRPITDDALVESFRRADLCDLSFGRLRGGIPRAAYRQLAATFPSAGFHKRIAQLAAKRAITHPWSPAPMMRW